ncbi:MAG: adenylyl-sulfate kinase [Chloroflexaceae bacterium]|jgi:adenylylsulfate kinase|nr:adenylyl-sulfate kinase [Chloroflexaceae bacterium]
MKHQAGWCIWFTGLPASGKSTLARQLWLRLQEFNIPAVILDSDELRPLLAAHQGYSDAERDGFYARLVALAQLLSNDGVNVIIAATGNRRRYRQHAAESFGHFAEVWVRCPPAVCSARDRKGLYARAASGAIQHLPGVDAAYESPEHPALILDTFRQDAAACVTTVLSRLPFLHAAVWETARD